MTNNLLSVTEAQAHILSSFQTLPSERVALAAGYGRVLAQEIRAELDMPSFTNSSMDGFAVRAEDVQPASARQPVALQVIGDIPAGVSPQMTLTTGQTARIMTGAPLPDGADAVVPVEETDQERLEHSALPGQVLIYSPVQAGQYVRPRGQDLRKGDVLLRPGHSLQPQDIGLLASFGWADIQVYRQPRVALFSSGSELVEPGQPLQPGQIYDSNAFMLSAMLTREGAGVIRLGTAPDDPQQVYQVLHSSLQHQVDLIVTSAGVSVGAFDYVKQVIEEHGLLTFWRVNMRPGKPVAFGSFEGIPFIGLPGNPVSAFVGCKVFVLPVVQHLSGKATTGRMKIRANLTHALESDGRESYLRAWVQEENGKWTATLTGHQGSGNLFSLVQANALLIVPSGVKSLPSGSEVEIWFLNID